MEQILKAIEGLGQKIDNLDNRIGRLENRIDKIESRMSSLENMMGSLENRMDSLESRVDILDEKIDKVASDLMDVKEKLEIVYIQTADLTEFRTVVSSKLERVDNEIEVLVQENFYRQVEIMELRKSFVE